MDQHSQASKGNDRKNNLATEGCTLAGVLGGSVHELLQKWILNDFRRQKIPSARLTNTDKMQACSDGDGVGGEIIVGVICGSHNWAVVRCLSKPGNLKYDFESGFELGEFSSSGHLIFELFLRMIELKAARMAENWVSLVPGETKTTSSGGGGGRNVTIIEEFDVNGYPKVYGVYSAEDLRSLTDPKPKRIIVVSSDEEDDLEDETVNAILGTNFKEVTSKKKQDNGIGIPLDLKEGEDIINSKEMGEASEIVKLKDNINWHDGNCECCILEAAIKKRKSPTTIVEPKLKIKLSKK
ncbi:OLC1v1019012C1 [Oldenlandia corymbosa var. corymbosa]|uniref:OLC1v1019012C1 n=1 Tax=Oldenlandia corymbosa var. corymbosa TaxID=529605 RepID=A0AAV1EDG8_OLDCO|nr:OLC1v1019012C1 [Oldenlandia corymbosa var. corymbosa]